MKKFLIGVLFIIVLLVLTVFGYLYAKPKVVLRNLTDGEINEFQLKMPSSRIVIGPIKPGDVEVVYFSFQERSGQASYSIHDGNTTTNAGEFHYDSEGQFFRKLEFTFQADGSVKVDVRD